MGKNRFFISYGITTALYGAIATTFFALNTPKLITETPSKEQVMQLSLATFVPKPPPELEDKVERQEKAPKKTEPPKKEIQKSLPKPIEPIPPKPKKEMLKIPPVLPIPQKQAIQDKVLPLDTKPPKVTPQKPPTRTKTPEPSPLKTKKQASKKRVVKQKRPNTRQVQLRSQKSTMSKGEKNRLLSTLRARINKHKSYPRIAQRRGIQGKVKVSFKLLGSGKITSLKLQGSKIFYASVRKALRRALPLNTKKFRKKLPLNVSLTLWYKIR